MFVSSYIFKHIQVNVLLFEWHHCSVLLNVSVCYFCWTVKQQYCRCVVAFLSQACSFVSLIPLNYNVEILLFVIHHIIIFHLHLGQAPFYFVSIPSECGQYDDCWTQEFDLFDILVIFSWGVKWMGHEADHSVQLVLRIRISGDILPLPPMAYTGRTLSAFLFVLYVKS